MVRDLQDFGMREGQIFESAFPLLSFLFSDIMDFEVDLRYNYVEPNFLICARAKHTSSRGSFENEMR